MRQRYKNESKNQKMRAFFEKKDIRWEFGNLFAKYHRISFSKTVRFCFCRVHVIFTSTRRVRVKIHCSNAEVFCNFYLFVKNYLYICTQRAIRPFIEGFLALRMFLGSFCCFNVVLRETHKLQQVHQT